MQSVPGDLYRSTGQSPISPVQTSAMSQSSCCAGRHSTPGAVNAPFVQQASEFAHSHPASSRQALLQHASSKKMPGSHSSPASTMPSPHTGVSQDVSTFSFRHSGQKLLDPYLLVK